VLVLLVLSLPNKSAAASAAPEVRPSCSVVRNELWLSCSRCGGAIICSVQMQALAMLMLY
jgi:hypothetical protein